MSYYQDYIDFVDRQVRLYRDIAAGRSVGQDWTSGRRITKENYQQDWELLKPFAICAEDMKRAKIVRVRADQTAIFLDTPTLPGQDYVQWFRLPFPRVYIHPEQAVQFRGYVSDQQHAASLQQEINVATDPEERERLLRLQKEGDPLVRGVQLTELSGETLRDSRTVHVQIGGKPNEYVAFTDPEVVRLVVAVFLMPLPGFELNIHGVSVGIRRDNTLSVTSKGHPGTRARMVQWLIHMANFLSSPSVKLAYAAPSPALQKARVKHGKAPLPGWYEITYRRHVKEYSGAKIAQKRWEHGFRYDVHGHFKTFTRGPMAGRVLWCPPHQRGLKHQLYKPKGYRQEGLR